MRDEVYSIPPYIFLEFRISESEFIFLNFSTAEFEKNFRPESSESNTESEFHFQWGSQKLEPKIGIPNLVTTLNDVRVQKKYKFNSVCNME
jgi:hypothetical protein